MIPNTPDFKIITIPSNEKLGINLKTTYTNSNNSSFFDFFTSPQEKQQYPVVCKIDVNSDAYKCGLRIGHTITKLNNYSLEFKDRDTLLSDFIYEKSNNKVLHLTIY